MPALLPTLTVLAVLGLVEALSRQLLLFASLASSAFLIYLAPRHKANSLRTLCLAQGAPPSSGCCSTCCSGRATLRAGRPWSSPSRR
jgi:hypothetical protein